MHLRNHNPVRSALALAATSLRGITWIFSKEGLLGWLELVGKHNLWRMLKHLLILNLQVPYSSHSSCDASKTHTHTQRIQTSKAFSPSILLVLTLLLPATSLHYQFTCRVGKWVPLHYWQLACLPKHTIWKHRITSIRLIGSHPSVETTCHNVQTSMCALFSPWGASSSSHLHRHGSSCGIPRSSIDHLTPQLASKTAESFSWWDKDKFVYEQWWTTFS